METPVETLAFGDALALARRNWIRESAARLAMRGFDDYRRSDAFVVRQLARHSSPLGELGKNLAMTRQGGRKVVDGLVSRGYARVERDESDARKIVVTLTARGERYCHAIIDVIDEMNDEVRESADANDLAGSLRVLNIVHSKFS